MNEGQLDQILLQWLNCTQDEEEDADNPGLPPLHRRDGVHCVGLVVDIRHGAARERVRNYRARTNEVQGPIPGLA
jgi:hypothetical protein